VKGIFIAIEGVDGSGSTTQAKRLCDYLTSLGRKAHYTAEPSSGPLGAAIRKLLSMPRNELDTIQSTLALAFAADRLHHCAYEIEPKLAAGFDVVTDRYVLSSLVYQGLHVSASWIDEINKFARAPDFEIVVDVLEDEAGQRRGARGVPEEIFEERDLQVAIRKRYLALAKNRGASVINGLGDRLEVQKRINALVHERMFKA
jgi:dTMP kinase